MEIPVAPRRESDLTGLPKLPDWGQDSAVRPGRPRPLLAWEGVVDSPRRRLVSLWASQSARALADGCLVGAVLAQPAALPWPAAAAAVAAVALVVGPAAGVLGDRAGRRPVLAAGCLLGLAAAVVWVVAPGLWPAWLGLLAAGAVIFGTARDALLPAAARDTGLPLARVVSAMRLGTAGAAAAGVLLGRSPEGATLVLAVALPGSLLALAAALPARFAVDALPSPGVRFLREGRRLLRDPDTRDPLVALAGFVALVLLGGAAVLGPGSDAGDLPALFGWVALGAAAGSLLAAAHWHPCRVLYVVPAAVTGLAAVLLWSAHSGAAGPWPGFLAGLAGGLVAVPLATSYLAFVPHGARGHGVAWLSLAAAAAVGLTLAALTVLDRQAGPAGRFGLLAAAAAAATAAAWWAFFREFVETSVEVLIAPCYRVRVHGPGVDRFPPRGPLLVLANHGAWFDPLWLCKAVPRRTTPLMISIYYDRPVLHWLMARVVRAIRVQDTPYRRDAPELEEAVAALDRGECVMIFPEGVVRRKEEMPLRHFGQGIWRILRERPATPVVVCWIEGGWRSFTSFYQGRPMTNKPLDWRRPIDIVMEEPQVLDPALLEDQRATRNYLEQACLEARRHLEIEEPAEQPVASGN
jgi:1-acyl-sn-glycerol-3-phosphate acyltransferase